MENNIKIYTPEEQAYGEFNGGAIVENKPVGFPQDGGSLKPYSNLFYWAHARSEEGSTIGEHPHQAFEILSFVIKGDIEHYDSNRKDWLKLKEGDVQIIRSGNGITHAERLNAGAEIFQIWFDPNFEKSLHQPASYNDYRSEKFPVTEEKGIRKKIYRGAGSPMEMESPDVKIEELSLPEGEHVIAYKEADILSAYLIEGELEMEGKAMKPSYFALIRPAGDVRIKAKDDSRLFVITNKENPGYVTYASRMRWG